jgi:hypothetical protein
MRQIGDMSRQDAISEMKGGKKVAHMYFSSDEWMKSVGGLYVFEDGCRCTPGEFWRMRTGDEWDSGWRVVA